MIFVVVLLTIFYVCWLNGHSLSACLHLQSQHLPPTHSAVAPFLEFSEGFLTDVSVCSFHSGLKLTVAV